MLPISLFWRLIEAVPPFWPGPGMGTGLILILLDVLAFALLVIGGIAFFLVWRKRLRPEAHFSSLQPPPRLQHVPPAPSIFVIFPLLMLLLAWIGTSSPAAPATKSPAATKPTPTLPPITAPANTAVPGELTIGTTLDSPPQAYLDPRTQRPTGFAIDLATTLARYMGLQANIQPVPAHDLIGKLTSRQMMWS